MSITNTGGPAFPTATLAQKTEGGMTLRDYFAAMAMQAMLSRSDKNGNEAEYAEMAYFMADAMLRERAKHDRV